MTPGGPGGPGGVERYPWWDNRDHEIHGGPGIEIPKKNTFPPKVQRLVGPPRGVQWRSLSGGVGASRQGTPWKVLVSKEWSD